jgi:formamidopyrimidine-DNA glycosylase
MPEEPNVHVYAEQLAGAFEGNAITEISTTLTKGTDTFDPSVTRINAVGSHGKYMWVEFDKNMALSMHFGLEVRFIYSPKKPSPVPKCSVLFGGTEAGTGGPLWLCVTFPPHAHGKANFCVLDECLNHARKLGPSIWDINNNGSCPAKEFQTRIQGGPLAAGKKRKRGKNICVALMDQHIVSGIGNYIKCEALHAAHIHPMASTEDLSDGDYASLWKGVWDIAWTAYNIHLADTSKGATQYQKLLGDMFLVYKKGGALKTPDGRKTYMDESTQIIGMK